MHRGSLPKAPCLVNPRRTEIENVAQYLHSSRRLAWTLQATGTHLSQGIRLYATLGHLTYETQSVSNSNATLKVFASIFSFDIRITSTGNIQIHIWSAQKYYTLRYSIGHSEKSSLHSFLFQYRSKNLSNIDFNKQVFLI